MNAPKGRKKRGVWWFARLGWAVAGVMVCGWAVAERAVSIASRLAVSSSQPRTRSSALADIADRRDARALEAVLAALDREQDRVLLEQAGHAALRIGDLRSVPRLQRRADQGPDDRTRAELIVYAARLSRRDPRLMDWLRAAAAGPEPWRRAGALLGLLELGRPESGRALVELLPGMERDIREFAFDGFYRRPCAAVLETVGTALDIGDLAGVPPTDPRWARLLEFWSRRVSPRLLNDVLDRQDRRDADWVQVGRLVHARETITELLF